MISRKQAILQVAAGFFSERGYRETSMSEVAKVAGVADGTVFYNFKTKEELYLAVLDEFRGHITLALDEFLAASEFATGLQRVEGLIGFCTVLVQELLDESANTGKPVRVRAFKPSRAVGFYERMGFRRVADCMAHPLARLVLLGLTWAFAHHLLAGARHLALDAHWGTNSKHARQSSFAVMLASGLITLLAVWKLFA